MPQSPAAPCGRRDRRVSDSWLTACHSSAIECSIASLWKEGYGWPEPAIATSRATSHRCTRRSPPPTCRSPGTIPDQLDGRYLRNGPNPVVAPDPAAYHWFLGSGMVHGVRLREGRAEWYRNRWVRSARGGGGAGRGAARPGPVFAGFDFAANTNVIGQAGRTFAIVEAGRPPLRAHRRARHHRAVRLRRHVARRVHGASPPRPRDRRAARRLLLLRVGQQGAVLGDRHRRPGPANRRHRGRRQPDDARLLAHRPARRDLRPAGHLRPRRAPIGRRRRLPVRLEPGPTRPGSACCPATATAATCAGSTSSRATSTTRSTPTTTAATASSSTSSAIRGCSPPTDNGPNEGPPTLDRWTVDLTGDKVLEERLDDRGQEFPRVDERLTGRRHRFGYAPAVGTDAGDIDLTGSLLKHDLVAGRTEVRSFGPAQPRRRVRVRAGRARCRGGRRRADGVRPRRRVRPDRSRPASTPPRSRTSRRSTCR